MYKIFLPHLRRLMNKSEIMLTLVDLGSRGGIVHLAELAERVDAYGFEPNPEQLESILSGKFGKLPTYHSINYSPFAVHSKCGLHTFYVTRHAGASGMLELDLERLREIKYRGPTEWTSPNFGDACFTIEKTLTVETTTLGRFCEEKNLDWIDFLKIDVEGSEYECLLGAGDFLRSISVIEVEVCFIPFRKGQKLMSDVDVLLRPYGFDLLTYRIRGDSVGYKERCFPADWGAFMGLRDRFGQPLSGDAIYVNRNVTSEKLLRAQAVMLISEGYLDEGLFILKNKCDLRGSHQQLLNLLQNYQGGLVVSLARTALNLVYRVASSVRRLLRQLL